MSDPIDTRLFAGRASPRLALGWAALGAAVAFGGPLAGGLLNGWEAGYFVGVCNGLAAGVLFWRRR